MKAPAALSLRRRRVAVAIVHQLGQRRRGHRASRVGDDRGQSAPIDRQQRLVLVLGMTRETLVRACRVLEHAPGAQQVQAVSEGDARGTLPEIDLDRRLDVCASTLDLASELGDRRLRAAPFERHQR